MIGPCFDTADLVAAFFTTHLEYNFVSYETLHKIGNKLSTPEFPYYRGYVSADIFYDYHDIFKSDHEGKYSGVRNTSDNKWELNEACTKLLGILPADFLIKLLDEMRNCKMITIKKKI